MLKRLYVDNVRCLLAFELRPRQVSALVGPNGGGKSTIFDVLQSIQMLLGPGALPAQQVFPPETLTRWDSRETQTIELEIDASNSNYIYRLEITHDGDRRNAVIAEHLTSEGQLLYRHTSGQVELFGDSPTAKPHTSFPADARRSFLPILEPRPDNQKIISFKRWVQGLWLFRLRPEKITPFTREESDAIAPDGSNFVSWYRTLQQELPQIPERVRADMGRAISGLSAIRLQRALDQKLLTFDCLISGRTFSLYLHELSEGQRVLLVLYSVMHALADKASLLMFDEPDNFVAVSEIQPWLAELRSRVVDAGRGTLMVMSHHPEVIDYLAADQVLVLWRDGGPARQREFQADLDNGLSASKALTLGIENA